MVGKLISTPSSYPRAYICEECVANCQYIIEEDKPEEDKPEEDRTEDDTAEPAQIQDHPLLSHPLAPSLMAAIENWVRDEAAAADVRRIAMQMLSESRT